MVPFLPIRQHDAIAFAEGVSRAGGNASATFAVAYRRLAAPATIGQNGRLQGGLGAGTPPKSANCPRISRYTVGVRIDNDVEPRFLDG